MNVQLREIEFWSLVISLEGLVKELYLLTICLR